ncbi:methyl-accepting chemotaxis protein [Salinivibrio proteolyticus]|uniref:methyl-accepting chemotaxis protein n=1 Tax=Salinivibrio proteolyticus TaxID=334715 RepID=UPI0009897B14|nr:methyl-accepting chemotaxis protein [Salinivibrio proteolyticus]OOF26805.1 methyl-accepting chemotaxis protein [Salinivibrio proteolyticus]
MAKHSFYAWEKPVTNLRLVPKLVILMVFSTVLLVGKQLWDAQTFRQSVVDFTLKQTQELARSSAAMTQALIAQPDGERLMREAVESMNAEFSEGAYLYLVNDKKRQVWAHPSMTQFAELRVPDDHQDSDVADLFLNQSSAFSYTVYDGARHGYAVPVAGSDWWIVASQPTSEAQSYYHDYMIQIAWQTALMIISFMVILLGGSNIMLRQINYLTDRIRALAQRDLSEPIEMNSRDEFGDLARELETSRQQLVDVIDAQRQAADELSSLAEIMTISMAETKESAQEQFAEIDQLASAMSEMSATVQNVAEHTREASKATEASNEQAASGQRYVGTTINTINELSSDISQSSQVVSQVESQVEKIGTVVVTIQGISEQTNLLALNAAIEAARAGDSGRGFAVVADEVRKLAQHTQEATVEIQDMITQLQQSAQQAVSLMERSVSEADSSVDSVSQAGGELDQIVAQIRSLNDMNFQIASSSEQQASVAGEMNQNLTNVKELVQASVTVVTELHETAEMVEQSAQSLNEKIGAFKI